MATVLSGRTAWCSEKTRLYKSLIVLSRYEALWYSVLASNWANCWLYARLLRGGAGCNLALRPEGGSPPLVLSPRVDATRLRGLWPRQVVRPPPFINFWIRRWYEF
ncbi:hypothetical protein Bbelb_211290 [Branchiostoma belcheri]|nr:hypothetical protein Bbelb_211290 [Branchiostoma belcheri]